MRKLISMFMAAAAAVSVSSCAQEEFDDYQEGVAKVTFMATIRSEDADTKAALGQNEEGKPQSVWTVGDKITVHNGDKGFEFVTADAGASAEFTYSGNDFTAEKGVIAVYPSGDYKAKPSKRTATVSIPSVQTAVAGSYDPAAAISVAYSNDEHLRFKNVTALLKFTVGTENIKSVIFEGLDGEAITGDVDIEMAEDGTLAELECSPKEQKSFARARRNGCEIKLIPSLVHMIETTNDAELKLTAIEAIGWYMYLSAKADIIAQCGALYAKEKDEAAKAELLKTLNRLK